MNRLSQSMLLALLLTGGPLAAQDDPQGWIVFSGWDGAGAYLLVLMHPTDAPMQTQLQILDRDGALVQILLEDLEVHHFHRNPGIDWIAPSPP